MKKTEKKNSKNDPKTDKFSELNRFLKIVSDENRLKILLLLIDGEMNVTNIYGKLKIPQNLTSHHISKLKSLDLLVEKKDGTFRNYRTNSKKLRDYGHLLKELMKL